MFSRRSGTTKLRVVAVALIPTHTGVIALARSAFARNPSASLAQQIVAAATSFPSATATRPTYSAPIPIAAETIVINPHEVVNKTIVSGMKDVIVTLCLSKLIVVLEKILLTCCCCRWEYLRQLASHNPWARRGRCHGGRQQ